MVLLLVVALAAVVLAATAVIAVTGGRAHETGPPEPSASTAAPTVTSAPPSAVPTVGGSDVFDGWGRAETGGGTRFLETDHHRGGDAALLVVRPESDAPASEPTLAQSVTVPQDSRITVSFWASSDGASADGAVQVRIGDGTPAVVALPAGAYDWTRFSGTWTVPARITTASIAVVATGPTTGARIDDVAVQTQGSRGAMLQNAGFERSSAAVTITDRSLVVQRSAALHLVSRLAPAGRFTWSAQEYTGGRPVGGRGRFEQGAAVLPLDTLEAGYYTLTFRVPIADRTVVRSTDLVVTTAVPVAATEPLLGVGVHLGALDPQLDGKLGDLASLGVRAVRTDADWTDIERHSGQYDFSRLDPVVAAMRRVGLRPLLIPGYRNALYDGGRTPSSAAGVAAFARFAAAVARRYPDVDIDVYNEFDWRFNDGACGRTAQCYLPLLRAVAAAVRAASPAAAVAGPDITGTGVQQDWLQTFVDGGGLGLVDAVDLHPYVQPERPDVLEEQLDALHASTTAAGRADVPIWFTEFGTATMPGQATERQQAEDVARVFGVAATHGVTRIYWYDAVDDGPDRLDQEDNFGIFRTPDSLAPLAFVPKPAAAVFAALARAAGGRTSAVLDRVGDRGKAARFPSGASVAWSAVGTTAVEVPSGLRASSMTGRPIARPAELGSAPVLLLGIGMISPGSR